MRKPICSIMREQTWLSEGVICKDNPQNNPKDDPKDNPMMQPKLKSDDVTKGAIVDAPKLMRVGPGSGPISGLSTRFLDFVSGAASQALPPIERWNPAYCGAIDLRIARDGRWFYQGSRIDRVELVKLFARILRCEDGRFVLVTPVEKVGIHVEDAPFLAVEMEEVMGEAGPSLAFRTNLDEIVVAGPRHPLRFEQEAQGGLKPYLLVRGDLWARLTRALAVDLLQRIEPEGEGYALHLGGCVFPIPEILS
jgi:uncharacterized protein